MINLNEWLRRADEVVKAYNADRSEVGDELTPVLAKLVDEMRRWLGPSSELEEE